MFSLVIRDVFVETVDGFSRKYDKHLEVYVEEHGTWLMYC